MSKNFLFPFLAGAAIGAAAMWLAKTDREQINAILDKIENKVFDKQEPENCHISDGSVE